MKKYVKNKPKYKSKDESDHKSRFLQDFNVYNVILIKSFVCK
jgi:hypothetical protein